MLVLSRTEGESIKIGDAITVTVVRVSGDKVRLGVEAPGEVPVDRQEIYEKKQREAQGNGQARGNGQVQEGDCHAQES